MLEIDVAPEEAGRRLDVVLVARVDGMSRARARDLIADGKVRVNGRRSRKGVRVTAGDRIALEALPSPADFRALPDPTLTLTIAYEDSFLVVVDKPAHVPSHPLREGELGTVANALVARYPEMADVGYAPREPGIVHRLDTNTSGLMLAARDRETFEALVLAVKAGKVDKRYLALVEGEARPERIDAPIRSHPRDARKVVVVGEGGLRAEAGRPAVTEILSARPAPEGRTLVEVRAPVATRHQIRAHLAFIGHPLVGDALYGGPAEPGLDRHFLHASGLAFTHPRTGEHVRVESPLPEELARLVTSTGTEGEIT